MDNNNQKQLQIELKPEAAQGSYSNLAIISHSKSEFVIDFATMLPSTPRGFLPPSRTISRSTRTSSAR